MVDEAIVKIVSEYLKELSGKNISITKCFIFGSHVKNTASEDSDIDIMLVSPLFDYEIDLYLPDIWLSRIRTQNRIEPILVGEKRFETDDVSPILFTVRQEGFEVAA